MNAEHCAHQASCATTQSSHPHHYDPVLLRRPWQIPLQLLICVMVVGLVSYAYQKEMFNDICFWEDNVEMELEDGVQAPSHKAHSSEGLSSVPLAFFLFFPCRSCACSRLF